MTPAAPETGSALTAGRFGPVTATDIVRFAGAGGDFNPLHHDPEFAARAGFPTVIAMGQMHAGILAGWLTDQCGVENLLEFAVRFVAPVRLGDVLHLTGSVVDHDESTASLELTAQTDQGPVVTATAVVARRRTPSESD
jgi:3-hydroxybutyryl-CoA dehydratase